MSSPSLKPAQRARDKDRDQAIVVSGFMLATTEMDSLRQNPN